MERAVTIKVEKKDDKVIVSTSNGKFWEFVSNDAEMLVASMVGQTMADWFRNREYLGREILMTLNVSIRV